VEILEENTGIDENSVLQIARDLEKQTPISRIKLQGNKLGSLGAKIIVLLKSD